MSSFEKRSITADSAQVAITGAAAKARQLGHAMCLAVCDEAGILKAFLRMDGGSEMTLRIAQDKAYTAATLGRPTHALWDAVKNDPPLLHGLVTYPRVIVFGGGYPIIEGGKIIGAIGVSGGHYSDDMEVARAGLVAMGAPVG
ncbi:MAG: GlcG/HbpS family heme-binding protein [Hyphomicrobiaceae bacterium]